MREELKFRIFDDIDGMFIYSDWKYGALSFWDNYHNDFEKRYSIINYTCGTKDKHGKDIFLDDIVKTPAGIGFIDFDRCFYIKWYPEGETTLHDCNENDLEVIGNVYESPEKLLI